MDPALFLSDRQFRGPTTRPPQRGFQAHAFNAPTQNSDPLPDVFWGRFRPVFSAPKAPEFWADKPFTRCLGRAGGVVISEPFGIDRRGPKHTRAEQAES